MGAGCSVHHLFLHSNNPLVPAGGTQKNEDVVRISVVEVEQINVVSKIKMSAALAALNGFRRASRAIDKYVFLRTLQQEDKTNFYRILVSNSHEIMPYVYTPTVGEACQTYHKLPITTQGVYITADDAGNVGKKLRALPQQDVRVAVVTDGERILGLGDLGAGGMGISEGKILLYTVCAGVPPQQCLPVCLDVGTNNKELIADPDYKGLRRERLRGEKYDALVAEFMAEMRSWQPDCMVQFEDFGNTNAFRILEKYRHNQPCFNDDIQGTACITLAALLSALRVTGKALTDQRILFLGAGEAGVGIGELVVMALEKAGVPHEQAMRQCHFMDSKGLVCKSRLAELQPHKVPFAHDVPHQKDLISAIRELRPTALIGVSTIAGAFDEQVLRAMAEINERPIVFPLSNPTSKSECTFEQAVTWTDGRVVFASGSPFPPFTRGSDGVVLHPAQSNNAYVFPAVGYAAVLARAREISDDVFLAAAESLSQMTTDAELAEGRLFPDFNSIREVSAKLTAEVCGMMEKSGAGVRPTGVKDWHEHVLRNMYAPEPEPATASKL